MTCEETLNNINTNVNTLLANVANNKTEIDAIKLVVAKLDYLVNSSNEIIIPMVDISKLNKLDYLVDDNNKILISNNGATLADIHVALGINPPDTDEASLLKLLIELLGVSIGADSIKTIIDSKNYAPNITTETVSVTTQTVDLSTVNTKLDNLQTDSTKFKNIIGVL